MMRGRCLLFFMVIAQRPWYLITDLVNRKTRLRHISGQTIRARTPSDMVFFSCEVIFDCLLSIIILTVCPSLKFYIFDFFKTTGPILTRFGTVY
jgi:hypothetical protein